VDDVMEEEDVEEDVEEVMEEEDDDAIFLFQRIIKI
jgi:hypothetical protein